jgi:hypothetical protein
MDKRRYCMVWKWWRQWTTIAQPDGSENKRYQQTDNVYSVGSDFYFLFVFSFLLFVRSSQGNRQANVKVEEAVECSKKTTSICESKGK